MKRVCVRRSAIHGKGVFALRPLAVGERIFEYKGMVTTWAEAAQASAARDDAGHTFLFGLSDGRVIDGGRGGNGARWLNHACVPNCQAFEESNRVYIEAVHDIGRGEELLIDYALEIPCRSSKKTRADYACRCGARRCRGTMLVLPTSKLPEQDWSVDQVRRLTRGNRLTECRIVLASQ